MQCRQCQHENPVEANFCLNCGNRLAKVCPQCQQVLPPEANFCMSCGHRLATAPQSEKPESRLSAEPEPLSYTPQHLTEKILTSRHTLEGERKQVTVLFADIKDSTELIKDLDPEAAQQLLDPAIHIMMEAVHRFEGTVNQVLGDGIMSIFGAPIAHEDHAARACYAALAMQVAMQPYADEIRRSHGIPLQIRVGLNSGEVVVRSIGNDLHMDYSAVGPTTHLAARMEQIATPGSIVLSNETLRLVEGFVRVNALGPIPIKGMPEPIEVYELTGASTIRRRLQAAVVRGLTKFVGRDTEIDALGHALERAEAGHGQIVAAVGEAGVGKSRLVYEFIHSHRTRGWLVLESASVSYGKATPYFPIIDLLKRYVHIEDSDDTRIIRAKVTGHVLTLDETLQGIIPPLLSLLDALPEESPFLQIDPMQRRYQMLEALKRVLLRESQVQPLLLVFEDLHWIDSETQALLDNLVGSLPAARLLMLVNYRPEYQHSWGSRTYYTQLRLNPLQAESAEAFLAALLGNDASLASLKQLLIARTEGNPFFLEESVRTLVETEVLVGEPGAYCLSQELPAIQVPATVQAILAARIDRLPAEEKRLLQTAAVIGTEVPFPLLQGIAALSEEALHLGLAHLQTAEFLYETNLYPEREYTFKHALTHDVAYGSLLQERRRNLHAQIVEVMESLAGERVDEQVEQLAQHALRGEVWDKALAYYRQAGTKAMAGSANREAVACFEQALEAVRHLPESRSLQEQAIDLRLDLRNALFPLNEQERIIAHMRDAEVLAEALKDHQRLGQTYTYMASYFWVTGNHESAATYSRNALASAKALGDVKLQVMANYRLGQSYCFLGEHRRAIDCLRENVTVLEGDLRDARFGMTGLPSVFSGAVLVWCLAECGEFAEGLLHGEDALRIAEAADEPFSLVRAYNALGRLAFRRGDFQQAISLYEQSIDLCRVWSFPVLIPNYTIHLGYCYALSGQLATALPLVEQVLEQSTSSNVGGGHSFGLIYVAEVYLLAGRLGEARTYTGRALQLSRERQERASQAYALRLLGDITAHDDSPDVESAETHYRQALALAEELGMRPLQAHCHRSLGTLYRRTGQAARARTELSTALDMYRDMEMTFWLPETEAGLAAVEGKA